MSPFSPSLFFSYPSVTFDLSIVIPAKAGDTDCFKQWLKLQYVLSAKTAAPGTVSGAVVVKVAESGIA